MSSISTAHLMKGARRNWKALPAIVSAGAKVQFGGGLRTMEDAARALGSGVSRVVLGTAAIEDPDMIADLVRRFGADRIAVGIDARDGEVRTRGWQSGAGVTPETLALQMRALGIERIVYTDIDRDGLLGGVNSAATGQLARVTGMKVIASGGVASLDDVRAAAAQAPYGVDGVIIGRALYDGRIDLGEALAIPSAERDG